MIKKCDCSRAKQLRYFKEEESELPEAAFAQRKREYFRGQVFYNRLCDLITRIDTWREETAYSALEKEMTGLEWND